MKNTVQHLSLHENKNKLSEAAQTLETAISAINLLNRFRKFMTNLLNFQKERNNETSTSTLATTSNLEENKEKVSEKLIKLFFPSVSTCCQTHLNKVRVHRIAVSTAALIYTAALSKHYAPLKWPQPRIHFSDWSGHESRSL